MRAHGLTQWHARPLPGRPIPPTLSPPPAHPPVPPRLPALGRAGPRAGINVNDGMGGGDEITGNLLANTCRESGDHGPFNSWDRAPYITTIGLHAPRPSVFPQYRNIHHNFMLANYNSQEAIDNDDGSSFYHTHHNFFVYGEAGLKSDFGGHDNHHDNNVYAFVDSCFGGGNNLAFVNNSCVLAHDGRGYGSDCSLPAGMEVSGNAVCVSPPAPPSPRPLPRVLLPTPVPLHVLECRRCSPRRAVPANSKWCPPRGVLRTHCLPPCVIPCALVLCVCLLPCSRHLAPVPCSRLHDRQVHSEWADERVRGCAAGAVGQAGPRQGHHHRPHAGQRRARCHGPQTPRHQGLASDGDGPVFVLPGRAGGDEENVNPPPPPSPGHLVAPGSLEVAPHTWCRSSLGRDLVCASSVTSARMFWREAAAHARAHAWIMT